MRTLLVGLVTAAAPTGRRRRPRRAASWQPSSTTPPCCSRSARSTCSPIPSGARASPLGFAGPRRAREPGLALEDLPPIDVVLISHDHYDHLDLPTLRTLRAHGRGGPPRVLTGLGNGVLLADHGITNVRELDWWQSATVRGVEFTFVEARHRSGRALTDQMKTLWGGFAVRAPQGQVYFAGDTGFGPHFAEAHQRLGAHDLCLLPIAAYRPRDFMLPVHLDPAGAVAAHRALGCRRSLAIHHGTFQLTYESIDAPYAELAQALAAAHIAPAAFRVLGFGQSWGVAASDVADEIPEIRSRDPGRGGAAARGAGAAAPRSPRADPRPDTPPAS